MRQKLRDAAVDSLRPIARGLTSKYARILMYHRFGPPGAFRRLAQDEFEAQLRYLVRNYRVVPLGDLTDTLAAGRPFARGTVALTVDDGYKDFVEFAYPVIRKYRVPVTVYVVSRFLDQEIWLWFDAIHFLMHAAAEGEYRFELPAGAQRRVLRDAASRNDAWNLIADACLRLTTDARANLIARIAECLGIGLPPRPTPEYAAMTWADLRSLDPELVEIGVHTETHPILSQCTPEEQAREICVARARIEECTGRAARAFCYPNGQPADFNRTTVDILRREGFASAVVAHGGMLDKGADHCLLERLGAPESMRDFRRCIDGVWEIRRRLESAASGNGTRAAAAIRY